MNVHPGDVLMVARAHGVSPQQLARNLEGLDGFNLSKLFKKATKVVNDYGGAAAQLYAGNYSGAAQSVLQRLQGGGGAAPQQLIPQFWPSQGPSQAPAPAASRDKLIVYGGLAILIVAMLAMRRR